MRIKTIASGSKGNCTIVLCNNINLIIDMGITFLTLKKSLEENSLSFQDFSGILITHCHTDHIKGLASLIKKTKRGSILMTGLLYTPVENTTKRVPQNDAVQKGGSDDGNKDPCRERKLR